MIAVEDYKQAMRDAVCGMCVGFTEDKDNPARCVHEESGQCTLFSHLDEVVNAVSRVDSGEIEPYVHALRQQVCAKCSHQNARGLCDLRDSRSPLPTWCVLDSYFNVIVGAIEDVKKGQAGL